MDNPHQTENQGSDLRHTLALLLARIASLQGQSVPWHRFSLVVSTGEGVQLDDLSPESQAIELWRSRFSTGEAFRASWPLTAGMTPALWIGPDPSASLPVPGMLVIRGTLSSGALSCLDAQGGTHEIPPALAKQGHLVVLRSDEAVSTDRDETRLITEGRSTDKRMTARQWFNHAIRKRWRIFSEGAIATLTLMAVNARADRVYVWGGVSVIPYTVRGRNTAGLHPWLVDVETKTIRAEACWRAARQIKAQGFSPEVIVAHPGWGEALFLKQIWPEAKLVLYAEYFYRAVGADLGFDPEFGSEDPDAQACRVQLKNLNNLAHLDQAHAAISPTQWQADTFPEAWRPRIQVIHDGIDTDALCPLATARFTHGADLELTCADEVVTYVARHLDPYRGIHVFMRALPALLQVRPQARVVIVGGDGTGYGAAAPAGTSWKQIFVEEVKEAISAQDWARVHFVGRLDRQAFTSLLQVSRVHVYLSYPFVLSWSLLEAMSVGCCIVASGTDPVREVITEGEHGELVDFFDGQGLVDRISSMLDDPEKRMRLGALARQRAIERFDLKRICLPKQLTWINNLASDRHSQKTVDYKTLKC